MLQAGMSRYVMKVKEELLSSSSFTLITTGRIQTYQIATYSIRTLLKMDYWSPKHVELLNVMNKINHQTLCILLDYRYIAKWYTVHTLPNCHLFAFIIIFLPAVGPAVTCLCFQNYQRQVASVISASEPVSVTQLFWTCSFLLSYRFNSLKENGFLLSHLIHFSWVRPFLCGNQAMKSSRQSIKQCGRG